MRRIGLAVVFALSLLLAPVAAEAQQQAEMVYRVGWILSGTLGLLATSFRRGLPEHGHAEGQNLIFETRYDEGQPQRLPELVAELVRLRADVIFAIGDQMTKATKDATTTIPIVMLACDGISSEIAGKRLELLRQMLPRARSIAVLYNRDDPGKAIEMRGREAGEVACG